MAPLEELWLDNNPLTAIEKGWGSHLGNLRSLRLMRVVREENKDTLFEHIFYPGVFDGLGNLSSVNLATNQITCPYGELIDLENRSSRDFFSFFRFNRTDPRKLVRFFHHSPPEVLELFDNMPNLEALFINPSTTSQIMFCLLPGDVIQFLKDHPLLEDKLSF